MRSRAQALVEKIYRGVREDVYLSVRQSLIRLFSIVPEWRVRWLLGKVTVVPFLGGAVVRLYNRALKMCSYRWASTEWLRNAYFARPSNMSRGMAAAEASLLVWDYDGAREISEMLKAQLAKPDNVKSKTDLRRVLYLDLIAFLDSSGDLETLDVLCRSQTDLATFFYERAWLAHSMRSAPMVARSLRIYLSAIDFEPAATVHVVQHLYRPNEQWNQVLWSTQNAIFKLDRELRVPKLQDNMRKRMQGFRDVLNGLRLESAAHLNKPDVMERSIKEDWKADPTFLFHKATSLELLGDTENGLEALREFIALKKVNNNERAATYGLLGLFHEERREFDLARLFYKESYRHGGVPFWFPEYLWRYVSLLMAEGDWDEAIYIKRKGLLSLWRSFERLAKVPIERRIRSGELVLQGGAFILGCQGIGDDILRYAIFRQLKNPQAKYAATCDRRMLELYSNAMPEVEFICNSTVGGKYKRSIQEYIQNRDGVPSDLDPARVSLEVLTRIREYPDISISEDFLSAFIEQKGTFRSTISEPIIKASVPVVERVRQLLASLPASQMNVGISWRSGQRDVMRNKSYTELKDWSEILTIPGINFVNLQYLFEQSELDEVEQTYGAKIHTLQGIDLKDDLEDVAAICANLDVVISVGTTVREIAAGSGARTISVSSTPFFPDLYRVDENGHDVVFPNMTHITSMEFGSVYGVLAEIGRLLRSELKLQERKFND